MIKLELLELDRLEYYLLEFDQGTYDLHVQTNDIWTYPLSVTKCLTIQVTDQGTGRAVFSVDHIDNTKARVFGAGGRFLEYL